MSFESFKLDDRVGQGLQAAGYEKATPIQAVAIPAILAGRDVIGTAPTGTGKTAAFVLPILHNLLAMKKQGGRRTTRALIVTPTRELAEQIHTVINELGKFTSLRSATVYGGVGMQPQEKALQQGVEVIVACPGRLLDHLNRGNARLDQVEVLVIDEADRMLDMGFLPSIQQIMKQVSSRATDAALFGDIRCGRGTTGRKVIALAAAIFDGNRCAFQYRCTYALPGPAALKARTVAAAA